MKAGLATPEQLRKARAEQRREKRREPRGRRESQDSARTPGSRPPKRSHAAREPGPGSGGGPEHRKDGADPPAGDSGEVRHRPSGSAVRRPKRGRAEGTRRRPPEAPPGQDAAVPALNLRIRELLDRHALNDRAARIAFNFMREKTVRRVYVTDDQRRELASGELAVVGFRRRHHIVPAGVADEIQALRPIVFVHRAAAESGADECNAPDAAPEDDPYRDFPVPDDLHW